MGNSILAAVRVFTSHFYSHSIDPSSIFKFLMAQQPQLHCASGFICHGYPLDHSDQTDSKGPENLDGNSIGSLASRLQESGFNQLESSNINFNHRYENIFLDFFQPYILCQCWNVRKGEYLTLLSFNSPSNLLRTSIVSLKKASSKTDHVSPPSSWSAAVESSISSISCCLNMKWLRPGLTLVESVIGVWKRAARSWPRSTLLDSSFACPGD